MPLSQIDQQLTPALSDTTLTLLRIAVFNNCQYAFKNLWYPDLHQLLKAQSYYLKSVLFMGKVCFIYHLLVS